MNSLRVVIDAVVEAGYTQRRLLVLQTCYHVCLYYWLIKYYCCIAFKQAGCQALAAVRQAVRLANTHILQTHQTLRDCIYNILDVQEEYA